MIVAIHVRKGEWRRAGEHRMLPWAEWVLMLSGLLLLSYCALIAIGTLLDK